MPCKCAKAQTSTGKAWIQLISSLKLATITLQAEPAAPLNDRTTVTNHSMHYCASLVRQQAFNAGLLAAAAAAAVTAVFCFAC
jgi:hypothetical protein